MHQFFNRSNLKAACIAAYVTNQETSCRVAFCELKPTLHVLYCTLHKPFPINNKYAAILCYHV